jgi:glucose/arabinose dehydrogenase
VLDDLDHGPAVYRAARAATGGEKNLADASTWYLPRMSQLAALVAALFPLVHLAMDPMPAVQGLAPGTSAPDIVVDELVGGLGPITDFAFLPDGNLVIIEKDGTIRVRRRDGVVGVAAHFPVNDDSEMGLLGVAADPAFARTRRLFLYYSLSDQAGGRPPDRQRVVSVTLTPDLRIDPAAQKVLVGGLRGTANHVGGGMAIGPDGKLYVGVGDSGCNSNLPPEPLYEPTNHFASCLSNANGKILRVDLDGGVPPDNPLAGVAAATACGAVCGDPISAAVTAPPRTEIWAWGLRNPWRFWPDPKTGRLWVGDVGEITYEEIDVVEKGHHYGWPWREAYAGWPRTRCRDVVPRSGLCTDPVYACMRGASLKGMGMDGGCQSITGGLILDDCPWPASLRGRYLFGDNATSWLWALKVNAARTGVAPRSRREIAHLDGLPVSIHLGPDGGVYVATFPGVAGRILRVMPRHREACAAAAPR